MVDGDEWIVCGWRTHKARLEAGEGWARRRTLRCIMISVTDPGPLLDHPLPCETKRPRGPLTCRERSRVILLAWLGVPLISREGPTFSRCISCPGEPIRLSYIFRYDVPCVVQHAPATHEAEVSIEVRAFGEGGEFRREPGRELTGEAVPEDIELLLVGAPYTYW